jgi:hypothetical protein
METMKTITEWGAARRLRRRHCLRVLDRKLRMIDVKVSRSLIISHQWVLMSRSCSLSSPWRRNDHWRIEN